jgi:secondary thiamine-phosphate synthase enzyme
MRSEAFAVTVSAERRDGFVDLTDELRRAVKDCGVVTGCAVAYCTHTTCCLLINEWEQGALDDVRRRLADLVPEDHPYAHDDFAQRRDSLQPSERKNGRAHVAQMILGGTSQIVPVVEGEAALGAWQRLFLAELDDPKPRRIVFLVFGS